MKSSRLTPASASALLLVLLAAVAGCRAKDPGDGGARRQEQTAPATTATVRPGASPPSAKEVPVYRFEVVNTWPHDAQAFTQGLVFHDGALLESTGQYGASSLRRVELRTGRVLKRKDVPSVYFAEGITLFGGKVYQLTWQENKGFIYDPETFEVEGEFHFDGEGWGLANDGESLILSDGTNQIRFLDPTTFRVRRTVGVLDERGRPLRSLNELEYVRGEIYANIWHSDRIARIDPQSGALLGWIDLTGLLPPAERGDAEAVLNGIAYDGAGDRLFVTGKLWPKLFEVRVRK
ncbi:MAG TPA: glutaminyl-peptide cyclotransferase [Pyrinomonadaceae bacterium]|nr:glutaminyl-peptide cyclotransferase [Pyrinomonadaceae bacterium]